jgi:hypothetical protein
LRTQEGRLRTAHAGEVNCGAGDDAGCAICRRALFPLESNDMRRDTLTGLRSVPADAMVNEYTGKIVWPAYQAHAIECKGALEPTMFSINH